MSKARAPRLPSSITVGTNTCRRRSCGRSLVVVLGLMAVLLRLRPVWTGPGLRSFPRYIKCEIMGSIVSERRHPTVFPGFREMAERRHSVSGQLMTLRRELGLSQAEVAARMGTSQSAVARFEAGDLDVRLSTVQRYTTALGARLEWRIEHA